MNMMLLLLLLMMMMMMTITELDCWLQAGRLQSGAFVLLLLLLLSFV